MKDWYFLVGVPLTEEARELMPALYELSGTLAAHSASGLSPKSVFELVPPQVLEREHFMIQQMSGSNFMDLHFNVNCTVGEIAPRAVWLLR